MGSVWKAPDTIVKEWSQGASTIRPKKISTPQHKPKGDRNGACMVEAKNKLIYEIPEVRRK